MGKYVSRITYKGVEMLFMNARGVNEQEAIEAWDEFGREVRKGLNTHFMLIDGTDIAITPAILRKAKESSSSGQDLKHESRACFVGMSPIQNSTAELIARGMHLNVHFCKTLEEGKEWLVKEAEKVKKGN